MPSSLIFAGLVVLWLLILVPAVARRRQEVERPSMAALSGRVLERPVRHWSLEVDPMDTDDERSGALTTQGGATVPAARRGDESDTPSDPAADAYEDIEEQDEQDERAAADPDEGYAASGYYAYDSDDTAAMPRHEPRARGEAWERPPAAFRRGRGGFDAEAAALAAGARYAFRQRVVIGLLVLAVGTAIVAALALPALWWVHGLIDLALVGYLVYLRRQVRMEEAIRARRAARMAGTRRPSAADDPELDGWARRGREAGETDHGRLDDLDDLDDADASADASGDSEEAEDDWAADDDGDPRRVRGTGEPVGVLPAHRRSVDGAAAPASVESALPRLQPAPPPPLPAGTQLVDVDDEDDELPIEGGTYPRAAGE
ncbi:gephyrin-like molybdotransferase receptor GlpR [Pseudonocardia oroxyli]|uniref:Uncharacterized protein n=1 Tax=Pseudonocardia oroxyli TaxID=366584 RepID=A0A1G7RZ62_PSEOR|nr:gephyrin-like molybdotransferase receptor GlpR [Pseudonocardia oroxyli]SDG16048.1 hypothetical protein SAMN05216377_109187 [Pseudonocardia oroxyli]